MGYGTSVDVYAFGLCVLEMVTGRTPYCECNSVVAIYKRVLAGTLPENIRVLEYGWPEAFAFVLRCLTPLGEGTSASATVGSPVDASNADGGNPPMEGEGSVSRCDDAGGDVNQEEEGEDREEEEEGSAGTVSGSAASVQHGTASLSSCDGVAGAATLSSLFSVSMGEAARVPAAQPSAVSETAAMSGLARAAKPSKQRHASFPGPASRIRRSTAAELLLDPFLIACEDDSRTTTEHVRRLSEQQGFFCINSHDDPHRATQPQALQLGAELLASAQAAAALSFSAKREVAAPAATATAAVAELSSQLPAAEQVASNLLRAEGADREQLEQPSGPYGNEGAEAPSKVFGLEQRHEREGTREVQGVALSDSHTHTLRHTGSRRQRDLQHDSQPQKTPESQPRPPLPGGLVQGSDVSLASLADEVRSLRYLVAHSFSMLEWLVAQAPGGAQFLGEHAGVMRGAGAKQLHRPREQLRQMQDANARLAGLGGAGGGRARSNSDASLVTTSVGARMGNNSQGSSGSNGSRRVHGSSGGALIVEADGRTPFQRTGVRVTKGKSVKFAPHTEESWDAGTRSVQQVVVEAASASSGVPTISLAGINGGPPVAPPVLLSSPDSVDGAAAVEALIALLHQPRALEPESSEVFTDGAPGGGNDGGPVARASFNSALPRLHAHQEEQLRAALVARCALADARDQRNVLDAELAAARTAGESKQSAAATEFERSLSDITKSLEAIALKRRERGVADCAAAENGGGGEGEGAEECGSAPGTDARGSGRRERAEEELYTRKRELLLSRRADEERAAVDALAAACSAHAVGVAHCVSLEHEALATFNTRIAALKGERERES